MHWVQHKLTYTSGEAERGRGSTERSEIDWLQASPKGAAEAASIYGDGCSAETQVRLRARATFQSVVIVKTIGLSDRQVGKGLMVEPELLGGALAGVEPPEIDGQMPRHGDDGLLALGAGGTRALA